MALHWLEPIRLARTPRARAGYWPRLRRACWWIAISIVAGFALIRATTYLRARHTSSPVTITFLGYTNLPPVSAAPLPCFEVRNTTKRHVGVLGFQATDADGRSLNQLWQRSGLNLGPHESAVHVFVHLTNRVDQLRQLRFKVEVSERPAWVHRLIIQAFTWRLNRWIGIERIFPYRARPGWVELSPASSSNP